MGWSCSSQCQSIYGVSFLFSHCFCDLLFYRAVTFTLDRGIKIINIELFLWGKVLHCATNKSWHILICIILWDVDCGVGRLIWGGLWLFSQVTLGFDLWLAPISLSCWYLIRDQGEILYFAAQAGLIIFTVMQLFHQGLALSLGGLELLQLSS